MQKNVASQTWTVFAFDETDNTAKTGDAANITANLYLDGVQNAVDDTNPTELEDGLYEFDITQAESNADHITIAPDSATANIQVIGVPGAVWTRPAAFNTFVLGDAAGVASGLHTTTDGKIDAIQTDLGDFSGRTNDQSLLDVLGVPDIAGKDLHTLLVTDRLDHATYGLSALQTLLANVGYQGGMVWVDTTAANTNTVSYVDGVASNPVSTIAAAKIIADALGLKFFKILPGSSITLAQAYDDYIFDACHATVALGGVSINNSVFIGAVIAGSDDGSNANHTQFFDCFFGASTLGQFVMTRCYFGSTITLAQTGDYYLHQCFSGIAGLGTPGLDFGAALGVCNVNIRDYSGGWEIQNMGNIGADKLTVEGRGQLILNANCNPANSPEIAIRGAISPLTDNVAGGFVSGGGTISDNARYDTTQVLNAVVDDSTQIDASALNTHAAISPATAAALTTHDGKLDTVDTNIDTLLTRITAAVALASICTEARLAELDAANLPTDIAAIPTTAMRGTDSAALASVATEARLAELDAANLPTDIAAIPTTAMRGTDGANTTTPPTVGEIQAEMEEDGASILDTLRDRITAAVATATALATAQTDLDTLTDATALPGQEAPTATPTLVEAATYIYKFLINKRTDDGSNIKIFARDETTVDQKNTISDDGSIYTHGEFGTGP